MARWKPPGLLSVAAGLLAATVGLGLGAAAAPLTVAPGTAVQPILDAAEPGAVIRLDPGEHAGPIVIARPLVLEGAEGAVLAGPGEGSVVRIIAAGVTVRGLTIRGSGDDLPAMNAGVWVGKEGDGALIEGNRLERNLFGVYLWGPDDATVLGNTIVGRQIAQTSETGAGISIWNSPGSRVVGNDISHGADGIFVKVSKRNLFRGNTMRDVRFAVHYMYTNDSEISQNVSIGNDIGYAIMMSDRLKVAGNRSERDRDHGLMFNYANHSAMEDNVVREGGKECVFIYNANFNEFRRNWFESCAIGIHFTAGSERNAMVGNAFIDNQAQVKYVGTRFLDWSEAGRGNYWSDNPAFDLDGDGIADNAYRPNDIIDQVLWTNPSAKILVTSPAVQLIRWAQAQFPALQPGGVVDSAPLMAPPEMGAP